MGGQRRFCDRLAAIGYICEHRSERAVDAALHEFDALRALMVARMQMQLTLLAGTLTAIGVIAGLALQRGGDRDLLLLIPPLASVVAIMHTEHERRITMYGRYLNDVLWPYITKLIDQQLPSWQVYWTANHRPALIRFVRTQVAWFLQLISIAALIARAGVATSSDGYVVMWWIGVVATIAVFIFIRSAGFDEPSNLSDVKRLDG